MCEKLLSDLYVLFFSNSGHVFRHAEHSLSSMQDTNRNIHAKFGSNWLSNVRGEKFWKTVNNDNWCQVMATAHMASGQVS